AVSVLCGWDRLRIVAFRVWPVAVCRQVGHHARRGRPTPLGIRLYRDCAAVYRRGLCNAVFIPVYAAASLSAKRERNGFVHDEVERAASHERRALAQSSSLTAHS